MLGFQFDFSVLIHRLLRIQDSVTLFQNLLCILVQNHLEVLMPSTCSIFLGVSSFEQEFLQIFFFLQQQFLREMKFHYGIVLSTLFNLFFILAHSQLTYFREFNFSSNGTIISMDSLRFSQKIITFKAVEKNFQTMIVSLAPLGTRTYLFNLTSSQQIRSDLSNYIGGPNNYTSFTPSTLTRYIKNFTTVTPFFSLGSPNQTIIDCFYGPINGSLAVLLKNFTTGFYQMIYFLNEAQQNAVTLPIQATMAFLSGQVSEGNCHLLFQQAIVIYAFNASLNFIKKINFPPGTNSIVSMSANSTYFSYSYGSTGYISSSLANNYLTIDSVNVNEQIIDMNIAYPYLFISTVTKFIQYDIDAKAIISTYAHVLNVTGLRVALLSNLYAIYYQPQAYAQHLYTFRFDNKSTCIGGCTVCPNTYSLDTVNLWCVKNYSAVVVPVPVPANTSTTNNTNQTVIPSNQDLNASQVSYNSDTVNKLLVILGKGLTFSSFRLTPKIFVTFTFFVDDIQFYIYHRQNYSESVKFFMTKASFVNQIKISAWMLQVQKQLNSRTVNLEESRKYLKFFSQHPHNPEHIYFLTASETIYKSYLVVIAMMYVGSKILYFLVYLIREKADILSRLESCLRNKTKFIAFIIALMEPNISQLSFNCFMQIKFYFRFRAMNSLDLIACVSTLYLIIFYTIALYPLSYALGYKTSANQLLIRSKYKARSFFSEGYYFCFRAVIKGFIHSFFLENYQIQIGALITVDILILLTVVASRKTFQNFGLFLLFLGYNLTFMVLNISFEIGRVIPELMINSKYDTANFYFILTLVGFALLATLLTTLIEANKFRKKCIRWLFDEQKIIQRQKSRKALAFQSDFDSDIQSPHTETKQIKNKVTLSKISIRQIKKKDDAVAKDRWCKSIKQITNKSMVTKQETNAELESVGVLQRSMRMESRKSRGLIKIKKAKMKKFVQESKEELRKLIRLESQKWSIHIAK